MYKLTASILPVKIRKNFEQLLIYADIKKDPDKYLGFIIINGLLSSVAISLIIKIFYKINFFIPFLISLFIIEFFSFYLLSMKADKKTQIIEDHLPDALQLMAGNLRAGFAIDRALLLSIRPEFGALKNEINLVAKEITMGKNIIDSLLNMTKRVRGKTFKKTILLIVSGIKSGGELASLLEKTAEHLIQKKLVDKKVRSSVNMYVIFIFVAMSIGAPLLFGLSSYLIGILSDILSKTTLPTGSMVNLPFQFSSRQDIDKGFILLFSILFIITTVILGSLIVGLITKGREKSGVKYIIPLLLLAIGLFLMTRIIINKLVGGALILA